MTSQWSCGGLNPGPSACKADALPLSYNPMDALIQRMDVQRNRNEYFKMIEMQARVCGAVAQW
ncbi:hypothetical protein M514_16255 [Trichuris suis]|uniref:Uncharacterized protein n=1 Tax=Trichuris suis TaxID=68888 RepID=A0A085NQI9_9BILA|nr:hypothetical protein M514_16255 [Trichuris suis]